MIRKFRNSLFERDRNSGGEFYSADIACDETEFLFVPTWRIAEARNSGSEHGRVMFGLAEYIPKTIPKAEFIEIALQKLRTTRYASSEELHRINRAGNPQGRDLRLGGFNPFVLISSDGKTTSLRTMRIGAPQSDLPTKFDGNLNHAALSMAYEILMDAKPVDSTNPGRVDARDAPLGQSTTEQVHVPGMGHNQRLAQTKIRDSRRDENGAFYSVDIACNADTFVFVPTWLISGGGGLVMNGLAEYFPKSIPETQFVRTALLKLQSTQHAPYVELIRINTEGNPHGRDRRAEGNTPFVTVRSFDQMTFVYEMQPGALSSGPPVAEFTGHFNAAALSAAYQILMAAQPDSPR